MRFLDDGMRREVRRRLENLAGPVKLVFFKTNLDCETCETAEALLREVADLSSKIELETHNLRTEEEKSKAYRVDKAPALVVEGPAGGRVRFYGLPAGYEFGTLIESLFDAAAGSSQVSEDAKKRLSVLADPVRIQVFVTPTCPFCPQAVRTAQKLAVASPNVTADMVEAEEFPEQSRRYGVRGVPKIVVNDKVEFIGAQPESAFVSAILEAAGRAN